MGSITFTAGSFLLQWNDDRISLLLMIWDRDVGLEGFEVLMGLDPDSSDGIRNTQHWLELVLGYLRFVQGPSAGLCALGHDGHPCSQSSHRLGVEPPQKCHVGEQVETCWELSPGGGLCVLDK